jgi:hypothetical protein
VKSNLIKLTDARGRAIQIRANLIESVWPSSNGLAQVITKSGGFLVAEPVQEILRLLRKDCEQLP